jgi:hypothetical protein
MIAAFLRRLRLRIFRAILLRPIFHPVIFTGQKIDREGGDF